MIKINCKDCLKSDTCMYKTDFMVAEEEVKKLNEIFSLKPIKVNFVCNAYYHIVATKNMIPN